MSGAAHVCPSPDRINHVQIDSPGVLLPIGHQRSDLYPRKCHQPLNMLYLLTLISAFNLSPPIVGVVFCHLNKVVPL